MVFHKMWKAFVPADVSTVTASQISFSFFHKSPYAEFFFSFSNVGNYTENRNLWYITNKLTFFCNIMSFLCSLEHSQHHQWHCVWVPWCYSGFPVCVLGHSVVADFAARGLQPARLLCLWNFPGKNIKAGCHFLLRVYLLYCTKHD